MNALNTARHTIKLNKHTDDRLTALSKVNTTYNYNNLAYPTSLEDVKIFEIHDKLCINNYNVNDTNDVTTHQLGNIKYYKHILNLLLIYDEEHTKSHDIYITN